MLKYITNPNTLIRIEGVMNEENGISIFHILEYFLLSFLIALNYRQIVCIDKHATFIIKVFLMLLPLFTLLRGYGSFTREKDYFVIVYGIILFYIASIKNFRYKQIIFLGTTCVCLFGFIRFIVSFDQGAMIPYVSWLWLSQVSIFNFL